jgi:hypothetical protein
MPSRTSSAALAAVVVCLASAVAPRAKAQVGPVDPPDDRATYAPRAPGVAAGGVVLTLAGAPLLVGGIALLADGVARDERRELAAIDDLETSGGVLLLGGGAVLVGAGVPTIVWGLLPEEPEAPAEPRERAARPVVALHPGGASATLHF